MTKTYPINIREKERVIYDVENALINKPSTMNALPIRATILPPYFYT